MQRWLAGLFGLIALVLLVTGAYLAVYPDHAPAPALTIEPMEQDLGTLPVGTTRVIEFRITNSGDGPGRVVGLTRF